MRDLNFFQPYLGEKKESKNSKRYIYGLGIILVAFIAGATIWNSISILSLKKGIKAVENKVNDNERVEKYTEAEKLLKEKDILADYENKLEPIYNSIYYHDVVNSKLIVDISLGIPENVFFHNIAATAEGLTITGSSKDRVSIAELINNLDNSSYIKKTAITNISEGANDEYSFTINCSLREGPIDEN